MASKLIAGRFRLIAKEGSEVWGEAASGNPQIGFLARVKQPQGVYEVAVYLSMTEKAEDYSIERLRLLGVDGPIAPNVPLRGLGKNTVDCDIAFEEYGGKETMKVEIVVPRDEVKMDRKLDPGKASKLAERLMKKTANGHAPNPEDMGDAYEGPPATA
jgi:hypothetical protein